MSNVKHFTLWVSVVHSFILPVETIAHSHPHSIVHTTAKQSALFWNKCICLQNKIYKVKLVIVAILIKVY